MITNNDRSKWFGASDAAQVMGNWDTETFENWWAEKLGQSVPRVTTRAMRVGNLLEIPIIRAVEELEKRRVKLGKRPAYRLGLRLRANYDGITRREIIEIKTTQRGFERVPKGYWEQCQALMFATRKRSAALYAYQPKPVDYAYPYFPEIAPERLQKFVIPYDAEWVKARYLPRLKYLSKCLKSRRFPVMREGFRHEI